jgi:hypothetical protein
VRRRHGFQQAVVVLLGAGLAAAGLAVVPGAAAQGPGPAQVGRFLAPFEDQRPEEGAGACITDADGRKLCKPAAATQAALPDGRILYWDALEGTENLDVSLVIEGGLKQKNARTRLLDLGGGSPVFTTPTPEDGGANPDGEPGHPLPLPNTAGDGVNDGDLFCSDLEFLADGRVIAVGGTNWYNDPAIPGTDLGVIELAGLRNARIFDPATDTWSQSGSMQYERWYPSLVTLPDGRLLVASGVSKLVKPLYPDRPFESGTNVKQLEVYDPTTGNWSTLPDSANRSLPLFPRIHLLPNGHVYYDVAGQSFNPFGQSYDEAFWNLASTFDPATNTWSDLGIPGLGLLPNLPDIPGVDNGDLAGIPLLDGLPLDGLPSAGGTDIDLGAGFRGSTFSIMLPLEPGADGNYSQARFLSAGGTASAALPSPGTYLGTNLSRINTVTIDPATGTESLSTEITGAMNAARWYSSGVLLPTGDVMAFSGANVDEVITPGLGQPVRQAEMFDAETNTWVPMATAERPRTYHNTAMLLPDGRVMVAGHAPIPTMYLSNIEIPGFNPNADRDPTFEIYEPPYLFRDDRPEITAAPDTVGYGGTIEIETPDAADIDSVVMMRNTTITHLVNADQRAVDLPVVSRTDHSVVVSAPPRPEVAPAGPYLLFLNQSIDGDQVPSVAKQVFVGGDAPASAVAVASAPTTPAPGLPLPTLPPLTVPTLPPALPPSGSGSGSGGGGLGAVLGGLFGR